jgi:hypothetical protein
MKSFFQFLAMAVLILQFSSCGKNSGNTNSNNGSMVNRGSVKSVIKSHYSDIRKCYEKGLEEDAALSGEIKASFKYGKNGTVTACNLNQGLDNQTVDKCVCKTVKTWAFSSSFEDENLVNYSWNLTPGKAAKIEVGIASSDQDILNTNTGQVVKCYEKGLKSNRELAGSLGVAIHLNDDGTVKKCEIKQQIEDEEVGSCACTAISTWKFGTPEKPGKVIFYSWILKPETQKPETETK